MAKALIYSDPHIGVSRKANTTRESSDRLKKKVFQVVNDLLSWPEYRMFTKICCGDLFDKFHNDEEAFLQGYEIASKTGIVLAGNHDMQKDLTLTSSLDALDKIFEALRDAAYPAPKILRHQNVGIHSVVLHNHRFIPHRPTQEEFEKCLRDLPATTEPDYLYLHCSYERDFGNDYTGEESSLNLTDEMATKVLEKGYRRIFLGHEHKPAEYLDGRVIIVGNTYPTSFGDLSDKRFILLDTETDIVQSVPLFSVNDLTWHGPVSAAFENYKPFMSLVDDLGTEETAKIVRRLLSHEEVYAVRVHSQEKEIEMESVDRDRIDSLPELVRKMIEKDKPHLLELYDDLKRT